MNAASWLYLSSAATWLYRHGGRCPYTEQPGSRVWQCERWRFHKRGDHR